MHLPTGNLLKQLIPVAVIATVAAVLLVTPSFAAKRPSAWVTVNATTGAASTNLAVGDNLVFSGCGYAAFTNVSIVVVSPFATSFSGATTDSIGCFDSSQWGYTALMAGSYTVSIYQPTDKHNPSASNTFTVNGIYSGTLVLNDRVTPGSFAAGAARRPPLPGRMASSAMRLRHHRCGRQETRS